MSDRSTQDKAAAVQSIVDKCKCSEFQLSEEQVELLAAFLAECSTAEEQQIGADVLALVPDFGAENALVLVNSPAFFVGAAKFQETVGALPVLSAEMHSIRQQFSCLQALQRIVHPNEKNVMRAFLKMISGHQEISDALLSVCGLEGIENSTSTLIQEMKIELLLSIYAAIESAPLGAKIRKSGLLPECLVEALKGRSAAELLSEIVYRDFINDINSGSESKIKSFRFIDFCRLQGNSTISTPETVGWVDFCATTFSIYFEQSKEYCDFAYSSSTDYNYSGADKKLVFKVESLRRANEHLAVSDTDIKGPLEFSMVFSNKTACKSAFEVTKLRSKEMEEILQAVKTKPRKLAVVSSKKAPEAPEFFSSSSMAAAMVVDNDSKPRKGGKAGKGADLEESDPAECITSPEPTGENGNSTLRASSATFAAAAVNVAVARSSKEVKAKPDVARKGPKPASSAAAAPAVKAATAAAETPKLQVQSSSKKKSSSSAAAKENLPDTSSGAGNVQLKKRSMSKVDKSEPPSSPNTSARMRKKPFDAGREEEEEQPPQSRSASSGKSRTEAHGNGKLLKVDSAPASNAAIAVSTATKPKREKRARDDENTLNAGGGKDKGKDKDEDNDVEIEGAPSKIFRSHARRDTRKTDDKDPEAPSPSFLQENSQSQSDEPSFDMTFSGMDYDFGGGSYNNDDNDDDDRVTDIEIIFATIVEKLQSIQTQREILKAKKLMVEGANHASRQVDEFLKRWVGMHTADIASKQATLLSSLGTFRGLVEQLNASINVDILHFEAKVSEARAESERILDAHKALKEEIEAYNKGCTEEDKQIKKSIAKHRVSVAGSFETTSTNSLLPHFADDR